MNMSLLHRTPCNHSYSEAVNHSSAVTGNVSYMENVDTIGERIATLRAKKKLTQTELASSVGVSRVAVTKWESGETQNMKLANLTGLSRVFSISIEELITGISPARGVHQNVKPYNFEKKTKPKHSAIDKVAELMERMDDKHRWRLVGRAEAILDEGSDSKKTINAK